MRGIWFMIGVMACVACTPARADMSVYAVDGLVRVRPDDPPQAARNISISAARNEYEPLQVVVRAGAEGLRGVNAAITDFKGPGGAVIPASNVRFFREHYVRVTRPTPRTKGGAGWYPDALIPFESAQRTTAHKARFFGAPFNVEPGTNQPLWVDVFVPRDARPGTYSGVITVSADAQESREITVELTVWDFALPDTPSMRSNFGKLGTDIATAHKVAMNSEEFRVPEWHYGVALAEHRISPIIPNTLYPIVRDDGSIDPARTHAGLKRWIETFRVTGFPLRMLGDDPAGRDRARNVTHLRAMYTYLEKHGWEDMAYVYPMDEPGTAAEYEELRRRAKLIHEAQPGIEVLCTEQPAPDKPEWGTLVGSIDIWVPLWTMLDEDAIAERLRAGDEMWSYTALTQGRRGRDTPYWQLECPLLEFRIPMWMNWRDGITGMLYWSLVWWSVTPDMWTDPGTYRAGDDLYNGDGAFIYPGVDAGIDGPVVSMRLKQIREGFEDYEYLELLADRVGVAAAREIVRTVAPGWTQWNPDPTALYGARETIAQRIAASR